ACLACASDWFKNTTGMHECTPCVENTVSFGLGSTYCNCTVGFERVDADVCAACPVDTYNDEVAGTCKSCPANSVSRVGSVQIADCGCLPAFGNPGDNNTCQFCTMGYYKNTTESTECVRCPENQTSTWDRLSCDCMDGHFYIPETGGCQACAVGTFKKSIFDAMSCNSCP
ncbi:hypothetical protein T484DRAFT_1567633, partial [Baffinella frigidus]